jgi:hypothetical protein
VRLLAFAREVPMPMSKGFKWVGTHRLHTYTHALSHALTHATRICTLISTRAHAYTRIPSNTSYTHTLIHSYTHTLIHSYTHTLIHSYSTSS